MDLASERTVDRLSDLWGEGRCGGKGQGGSFRNPLAFEVTAVMSITRFKGYWTGCPRHMLSNSPVRSLGGQEVSWQVVAGDPQLTWVQAPGTAAVGSLMFAMWPLTCGCSLLLLLQLDLLSCNLCIVRFTPLKCATQ